MKVAFLFGSLNRGGTETLMLDVCRSLGNDDFEAIGIYRKPGVLESDFNSSGVPFFHLSRGKNLIAYLLRLRRFIKEQNIEILHAQQPIDALYGYLATFGLKRKVLLTFHGFDFDQSNSLIRNIIHRTHRNIFVSNYQKEYYKEKYKLDENLQRVVYNGLDFSKFMPVEQDGVQRQSIRKELNLSENSVLMGMVGNFNIGRDQMTVCRFLNLLNKEKVDFHFLFVGKRIETYAEHYDNCINYCLQEGINERVHFLGLRDDVPQILGGLDAFIYSTEHDTFGIAVVEAVAIGVPVFVNDWDVMKEITEDGNLATLYKSGDESDLLQKIMLFLQNKDSYKNKAVQASAVVRKKYSIRKHIEELRDIYKELLFIDNSIKLFK